MKQYHDLLKHVLNNGYTKSDRTGTGTISIFGYQMRFDLNKGFPLVTTKKVHAKSIIHELIWFLSGSTNIQYLKDNGVKIWDAWATDAGELGPVYGEMWRSWPNGIDEYGYCATIDQISNVIKEIKENPDSRRLIVSGWNPSHLPDPKVSPKENAANGKQALPPCHTMFQFYVIDGKLSCQLYQRSGDIFLGVPFNIASYALLTHMVAHECGLGVGEFIHTLGDAHIYLNHVDQVKTQLMRKPMYLPTLKLNPEVKRVLDFKYEDIVIDDYASWPAISAQVAV